MTRVLEIDVKKLRANNVREHFDAERLAQLTAQIKAHGVKEPLLVQKAKGNGSFEIVAGERRYRAAKMAGLTKVPCLDQGELSELDRLRVQATENLGREDLTPLEEGQTYEQLIKAGMPLEDLLKEFGCSKTYVNDRRRLAAMPKEVLGLVKAEKISITHVQVLVGLDKEKQVELAKKAAKKGSSPADLRLEVAEGQAYEVVGEDRKGHLLANQFAACQGCEKPVAGCQTGDHWHQGCAWEYKDCGPAWNDCPVRDEKCQSVRLCLDGNCRNQKAAELVEEYLEKHPELKKRKPKVHKFGRGGGLNSGAYAPKSKICRKCTTARRELVVDWWGVKVHSYCNRWSCVGRQGKDPKEEREKQRKASDRRAAKEAKRQEEQKRLGGQVREAAYKAIDRGLTPNDFLGLLTFIAEDFYPNTDEAREILDRAGVSYSGGKVKLKAGMTATKALKVCAIAIRVDAAFSWGGSSPKEMGNLVRELGGKVKAPAKPKAKKKAKPRLKK